MKNIKAKIWALLGMAVMLLPLALGLGSVKVEADVTEVPEEVTVNLHKLKFMKNPEPVKNTGGIMEYPGSQPLEGAEFTVYDVSSVYYSGLEADQTAEEIVAQLSDLTAENLIGLSATAGPTPTNSEGIATFKNLPSKTSIPEVNGKDAVYLFVESAKEGFEVSPSIVMGLPFYSTAEGAAANTALSTIELYAKNQIKESTITIQKVGNFTGADKLAGAEFQVKNAKGEYVTGNAETTGEAIYGAEVDAKTFTTDVEGAISVSGLLDGDYTLVETKAPEGYQLSASQIETAFTVKDGKLATAEGLYNDTDEADLGNPKDVNNRENTLVANTITVENIQNYGNYHFVKQDLNTAKGLAGAEFNIAKESEGTDYLYKKAAPTGDEYQYAWKSELTNKTGWEIVKLTSTKTGEFDITGLKYGTYYLHETVAPDGYVLPNSDFAFTVSDKTEAAVDDVIENQPKGILPSTGGMGIIAFVLAGIVLIGGAAIYFNKRRQETEA
ncbi:SpaA isopeptide-forming pilin-related protein [Enterococcus dongliensis]|uniref:SpaA isopeptide-forming pilin-related protein n=1 Tax=Enterococcus dongliensis TaxID=2559925 RepID=UPI00288C8E49|nr:SpaA isopeptide-forming pilin-related protein [Enterococcus dongliensis]MDT2614050.1 SpaA isopeptide-forming pilin-related protein [Enterococcus dongliensis]